MRRRFALSGTLGPRGRARWAGASGGRTRDSGYGMLAAAMVWIQLGYMVLTVHHTPARAALVALAPSPMTRLIKLALLLLGVVVVGSRSLVARRVLAVLNRPLLAFMALAGASLAWSIDPPVTAARLVALASMGMVCLAFGVSAWRPQRFQAVLRPAITLILLASLLAGLLDPTLVKEVGDTISLKDAWRGLTSQKNVFGELSSFGVIFWLHAGLARQVHWTRGLAGVALAAICLVLSRSSTSLFCTAFAVLFLLILMRPGPAVRRYLPYIVLVFTAACVGYSLAVLNVVPGLERLLIDPLVALTGKNLTFSGRTEIWQLIRENIARHPYLGSGFGAYWGAGPVPSSPSYVFVQRMWGFWPTEAHNGYYDMRNDLGIAGLLCLFGYLLAYLRQCLQLLRTDRAQAVLFLALLFQQLLINLTESTWLDLDNFSFTVMTAATVMLARALLEQAAVRRRSGTAAAVRRPAVRGVRRLGA